MIFNFKSTADAKTLGGKTAEEFANADHRHTADEVGALSKNGGDINGILQIFNHLFVRKSDASSIQINLINAMRSLYHEIDANGNYVFYDRTNGDRIIHSTKDGTNTFNGTASGNLPLDGGGTVYKLGRKVMSVKNTDGSSVSIGYESNSGVLGELGVSGSGAFFINKSGTTNYIHHDGNSAKVVISETAPADTSALWVY